MYIYCTVGVYVTVKVVGGVSEDWHVGAFSTLLVLPLVADDTHCSHTGKKESKPDKNWERWWIIWDHFQSIFISRIARVVVVLSEAADSPRDKKTELSMVKEIYPLTGSLEKTSIWAYSGVQIDPVGNQVPILRHCTFNNYPALEISS